VGQFFAPSEPETLVVVVPSKDDGHVGAVVVNPGPGQQVLDTAYASARTRKGSKPKVKTLAAGDLDKSFAAAREAAPPAPVTFTVHFVLGTNLLTSASRDIMGRVIDEVARRPSADVMVIGHTDQMGPEEYNDLLSLRRAESVRDFMAGRGVRREIIRTAGHGEREPLYTVEDGRLSSPENRRVEITVR
jgi:outer membrane protein OmpA-like peptidoglycan-associated protein